MLIIISQKRIRPPIGRPNDMVDMRNILEQDHGNVPPLGLGIPVDVIMKEIKELERRKMEDPYSHHPSLDMTITHLYETLKQQKAKSVRS